MLAGTTKCDYGFNLLILFLGLYRAVDSARCGEARCVKEVGHNSKAGRLTGSYAESRYLCDSCSLDLGDLCPGRTRYRQNALIQC